MILNEMFNEQELNEIIDKGLILGIERAKDENILDEINYNIKNGEHSQLKNYKKRLYSNTLNEKEKEIINKYLNNFQPSYSSTFTSNPSNPL